MDQRQESAGAPIGPATWGEPLRPDQGSLDLQEDLGCTPDEGVRGAVPPTWKALGGVLRAPYGSRGSRDPADPDPWVRRVHTGPSSMPPPSLYASPGVQAGGGGVGSPQHSKWYPPTPGQGGRCRAPTSRPTSASPLAGALGLQTHVWVLPSVTQGGVRGGPLRSPGLMRGGTLCVRDEAMAPDVTE